MSTSAQEGQAPQGNGSSTTGGQGQAPANGTGQGQEPAQGQQQGQQQQAGQESAGEFDISKVTDPVVRQALERQAHELKEARDEAARYRTERNTFQQQVTEHQRANETAEQTAERERQEREQEAARLREENRELRVGGEVRDKATALKAHNPSLVWNMVKDRIQTDDKGKPTNVETVLSELKQSDPYLFKRTTTDAGDGNEGDGNGGQALNMNDAIRRASGRA